MAGAPRVAPVGDRPGRRSGSRSAGRAATRRAARAARDAAAGGHRRRGRAPSSPAAKSSMLDMNVLGLRLKAQTASDPTTLTPTAMRRKAALLTMPAPSRSRGRASSSSTRCCASRPQLSPPSQVSRFQIGTVALSASMAKRAASKASPRWGAETTTTTADCAQRDRPDAVQQREPADLGPAAPGLGRDGLPSGARPAPRRPRTRASRHAVAAIGVVAGRAAEHHDRTAPGQHRPVGGRAERQRIVGQARPSRRSRVGWRHGGHRRRLDPSEPTRGAATWARARHYRFAPCPTDDDPDDAPRVRAPSAARRPPLAPPLRAGLGPADHRRHRSPPTARRAPPASGSSRRLLGAAAMLAVVFAVGRLRRASARYRRSRQIQLSEPEGPGPDRAGHRRPGPPRGGPDRRHHAPPARRRAPPWCSATTGTSSPRPTSSTAAESAHRAALRRHRAARPGRRRRPRHRRRRGQGRPRARCATAVLAMDSRRSSSASRPSPSSARPGKPGSPNRLGRADQRARPPGRRRPTARRCTT